MRGGFAFMNTAFVLLAAACWALRPAVLGDAGGLWAFADQTFPSAAALRLQYVPGVPPSAATATAMAAPSADKGKGGRAGGGKGGPAVVVTQAAELKVIEETYQGVGTVQAIASIAIRPRMDSQIIEVGVAEGAAVKAGDLLFRLDDRALRAQLAQSDAQLQKDQAQIDQATRDLNRADVLLKQKFLAPAARETAATAVSQAKAQLAVDSAQKKGLMTSLSYAGILAPVSGRIGTISAKPGTIVRSGDSLAVVNQIDPIYIGFALPQDRLVPLRESMAAGGAVVRVKGAAGVPPGKIAFLENSVDTATGTVQVRALMPNSAEKLWPGAFANIEVVTGVQSDALTVPMAAVQIGQKGQYVFVVRDGHAALVPVTVARNTGDLAIISAGLAAGDLVVIKGQMALTDGAEVAPPKPAKDKSEKTQTSSVKTATDG